MARSIVTAAALAAACWPSQAPAAPLSKQECAAAYEQTQALRKDNRLRAAREQAVSCSQDACPRFVRTDCARWLGEIEASQPTLVLVVRDPSGRETLDVRVLLDGELLREQLDGSAIPVDPGEHMLRVEAAGAAPLEQRQVIHEGDKLRRITLDLKAEVVPVEPPPAEGDAAKGLGIPPLSIALGVVGAVGVAAFTTLGLAALGEKGNLEDTCAPRCSKRDVSSVETKLVLADVSLAVGVVSLGAATALFLLAEPAHPPAAMRTAPAVRFGAAPLPGGGFAGVSGAF